MSDRWLEINWVANKPTLTIGVKRCIPEVGFRPGSGCISIQIGRSNLVTSRAIGRLAIRQMR